MLLTGFKILLSFKPLTGDVKIVKFTKVSTPPTCPLQLLSKMQSKY